MKFKRQIDYTKYNSNYETANAVDPVLYFTILMTTMCGLMIIGRGNAKEADYMSYTEMMNVEEQYISTEEVEEWDYFFDILNKGGSDKYQSQPNQVKKLILK